MSFLLKTIVDKLTSILMPGLLILSNEWGVSIETYK
jgi:hypothetical protein